MSWPSIGQSVLVPVTIFFFKLALWRTLIGPNRSFMHFFLKGGNLTKELCVGNLDVEKFWFSKFEYPVFRCLSIPLKLLFQEPIGQFEESFQISLALPIQKSINCGECRICHLICHSAPTLENRLAVGFFWHEQLESTRFVIYIVVHPSSQIQNDRNGSLCVDRLELQIHGWEGLISFLTVFSKLYLIVMRLVIGSFGTSIPSMVSLWAFILALNSWK